MMPLILIVFVLLTPRLSEADGLTRTYFIAAEDVLWDYAPSYPINPMHQGPFTDDEKVFVEGNGRDRIGHVYHKAHFVEYIDATFKTPKPRPPEWEHLGILGPVIRANVGDTIKIVFRNKTADLTTSIHPHGVFYHKDSEGVPYHDGADSSEHQDDAIPPGGTWTYTWKVPERAGPGPRDPSSIVWLYHSHVDEIRDTNTGLMGPIIISRKGERLPNGKLRGVDREFVVLFTVFDENQSLYIDRNIAAFAPLAKNLSQDHEDSEAFKESNLMHSMNGYVYDNIPGLTMKVGENVRWYQLALGTEVDLHTPHWHGNTLLSAGQRVDVVNLLPGSHITVDMKPDVAGSWMYHCHVNDHIEAGMMGRYVVNP